MTITTLADLIAQVESDGNQYAVRFEPHYTPKDQNTSKMAAICKCSNETARILCSMSFGYYQIMGDNLISLDLNVSPFEYMNAPTIQSIFLNRFLIRNNCEYTLGDIVNDEESRLDFAKKYNGPGNVDAYAARMLSIYGARK